MSESRIRSRSRSSILAADQRCIYCLNRPDTLEHMPPVGMFANRSRPSGMEFATCKACNRSTGTADLVASFFARLHPTETNPTVINELRRLRRQIEREAPRIMWELSLPGKSRESWPRIAGVLQRRIQVRADGPCLRAYLNVFASKMAFALYREHVGHALPKHGRSISRWFLNAGLAQKDADTFLSGMPIEGRLRQGTFTSDGQFFYRFNCDDREIVAALAQFHFGLYIFVIATSRPDYYLKDWKLAGDSDASASPGTLLSMLPTV